MPDVPGHIGKGVSGMDIQAVSILGLGAEGSVALRALAGKPCHVRILAPGERVERLPRHGTTSTGETVPPHLAHART